MGFSKTKDLIQRYQLFPNKSLGQNFIVDFSIFEKLSAYCSLQKTDTVLDVGSGFGFLTRFLSQRCNEVIAVEKDNRIASILKSQLNDLGNVHIIEGDVLKTRVPEFNKVVSLPPYQISSQLLLWLFKREFERAVLVLQTEFANRLIAPVGTEDYGWLTVFTFFSASVELLDSVPKNMFFPQPDVDSIVVRLTKPAPITFVPKNLDFLKQMLQSVFTERNKKLANALTPFLKSKLGLSEPDIEETFRMFPFRDKRPRTLTPQDFGALANALIR